MYPSSRYDGVRTLSTFSSDSDQSVSNYGGFSFFPQKIWRGDGNSVKKVPSDLDRRSVGTRQGDSDE